ncbi:MAG: hypothetical protein H6850_04685 [Alphaproteobacteria bacterium]|nr:MAG: hypothetical protein H6850_04685 [Alphaproteobacteria bacterium]
MALAEALEEFLPKLPFKLISEEIPPEVISNWVVTEFKATQTVSAIDEVSVTIMTPSSMFNVFDYMRMFVKLKAEGRLFSGMITNIEFLGIQKNSAKTNPALIEVAENALGKEQLLYRLILKPKLNLLTRRKKCQVFQEQPLDAILTEIFTANGLMPGADFLIEIPDLKPIPYCVQYCETDFDFVSRLLEAEQIYYYYDQIEDGVDQILTIKANPSFTPRPILYDGQGVKEGRVYGLSIRSEVVPEVFAGIDFDYLSPITPTFGTTPPVPFSGVSFEYPSRRFNAEMQELKVKSQLQGALTRSKVYQCDTTIYDVTVGRAYVIPNYPDLKLVADELFTIKVEHFGKQISNTASDRPMYFNRFYAVRNDLEHRYKPEQKTPWPKISGYQTAVVVGPAEAEIPDVAGVYAATKVEATAQEAEEEAEEAEEQAEVGLESAEKVPPTPPPVFTDPQGRIAVKFLWNMPVDPQELAEEEEQEAQEEALVAPEEVEAAEEQEAEEVKGAAETEEEAAETAESEETAGEAAEEEAAEEAEDEEAEELEEQATALEEAVLPPPPGSCWVRVMQGLAGPGYGTGFIPRIGMEVVIVFENGDPNRPVCVGCVYNGVNLIPEPLFEEKSRLVLSTMGAPLATPDDPCPQNAIVMQDMPIDEQKILIYGQNQIVTRVMKLNEVSVMSGNNVVNIPTGDNIVNINAGNCNTQINTGTYLININEGEITIKTEAGALNLSATDINITAEAEINISAGGGINIEAGANISAEAGADVAIEAGAACEISAGADVSVEAGAACEVSAGADISIEAGAACEVSAGADVAIEAGAACEVSAGADVSIEAGVACEMTAGADVAITGGGAVEVTGGGDVAVTGGGAVEVTGGGDVAITGGGAVEVDAGGAVEIGAGGAVSTEAGGIVNITSSLTTVESALVLLG